jgi:acetylglutamate kinase
MHAPYLVYLSNYLLGDPVFLQGLARTFRQRPPGAAPLWFLHGSGENAERAIEAQGRIPERRGGLLEAEGEADRGLIERSTRDMNRHITALLTDQVVSALPVMGTDRGLLKAKTPREAVSVKNADWLVGLSRQGVVPVVGLLGATEAHEAEELSPVEATAALAEALGSTVVCFLTTGRAGVRAEGEAKGVRGEIYAGEIDALDRLHEAWVPQALAQRGVPVLLSSQLGVVTQPVPKGTRVVNGARS